MSTAADRRIALVGHLVEAGHLRDPAWQAAWQTVPRERFVPHFFLPNRGRPGWRLVAGDSEWLDGVYSAEALVTQLDGDDALTDLARVGQDVSGTPTSSSSAPPLMAAMLDALAVEDGHHVFEAATGTGYNAALLAHRLGSDRVTSIEIDPGVTTRANHALREAGYEPDVRVGDATAGVADRAPFHRLISTVAVPRLPGAWLAQTHPGAVLVVPLVLAGHGGAMVRLERDARGGASGRVMDQYGGFMATRTTRLPRAPQISPELLDRSRASGVPVDALGGPHPATFFLSVLVPPFRTLGFTPTGSDVRQTWGAGLDGSVFAVATIDGEQRVAEEGPLWRTIEAAYQRWVDLGGPERTRVGITITATGDHTLWLDEPTHILKADL